MLDPAATDSNREARNFATTRWSLILTAGDLESADRTVHQALSDLCRLYWRPIFSFVCRQGYSVPDAQDLTQDFFVMILERNWLKQADRNRGRFRSLLFKSLMNFLSDSRRRLRAEKRGRDFEFVPWDEWMAEASSQVALSAHALESETSERLFDLRWAVTVIEQAMRRLREECESRGRLRAFEILRGCLASEREQVSYQALSQALGVPATTVRRLVHRFRQRYRSFLRAEVADTVADPTDVDDEIRHLCGVLAISAVEIK